jgi:alpha-tubulin suppressor-like RCC1 family protein
MTRDNRVQCWGQNDYGMAGDGTNTSPRLLPVWAAANLPYDAFTLSAGITHTCATRTSNAFCWGLNFFGALGLGSTGFFSTTPISVGTPATPLFVKVSNGGYHSCALTGGGEAWCWGWNAEGQVGANSAEFSVAVPTAVSAGTTRFTTLALGESHSCGLTADGAAWCWGGNGRGESGRDTIGADLKSLVPVLVSTSLAFTSIDAGTLHTCALTADGTAYCWGSREFGQLGDGGTSGIAAAPFAVNTSEKFTHIAAGGFTTCGVTTNHRVLCWGAGAAGALGNGSNSPSQATPVPVSPVLDARRVAVNLAAPEGTTVCAVTMSDAVFCWGAGSAGQLGNGTVTSSNSPIQVLVRGPL